MIHLINELNAAIKTPEVIEKLTDSIILPIQTYLFSLIKPFILQIFILFFIIIILLLYLIYILNRAIIL